MRPVVELRTPTYDDLAPLGPDSLIWRRGFPRTGLLLAGRSLLMQVAHPVIGAGVRDFSDFENDPWGRLDRTLTSLLTQLFGGDRAITEAARLRDLHRNIKGTGLRVLRSLSLTGVDAPYDVIPKRVWRAVKPLGRAVLHDTTVGSLPPALRAKAGIRWTGEDEARLARIERAVRGASRLTPNRTLHYHAGYRAMQAAKRYDRIGAR